MSARARSTGLKAKPGGIGNAAQPDRPRPAAAGISRPDSGRCGRLANSRPPGRQAEASGARSTTGRGSLRPWQCADGPASAEQSLLTAAAKPWAAALAAAAGNASAGGGGGGTGGGGGGGHAGGGGVAVGGAERRRETMTTIIIRRILAAGLAVRRSSGRLPSRGHARLPAAGRGDEPRRLCLAERAAGLRHAGSRGRRLQGRTRQRRFRRRWRSCSGSTLPSSKPTKTSWTPSRRSARAPPSSSSSRTSATARCSTSATSCGRCRSPSSKGDDGKWAFDTYAGLEEIINRRVGENELQAIDTVRAYVDAQQRLCRRKTATATACWNIAQKLISSEGQDRRALLAGRPGRRRQPGRRPCRPGGSSTRPRQAKAISAIAFAS